jgi:glycosyltransferase involved in cell wall biosynthesis
MISVVVLTFNEEANIRYTLESAQNFSDDIHVVDSFSTDRTLDIAGEFDVTIHQNLWDGWAAQRNWTQDNANLVHPWVLYLDADEILTDAAKAEILEKTRNAGPEVQGYYLPFEFWFLGRKISKAMVPHLRLVKHESVRWYAEGAREYNSAPKDSPTLETYLIHKDNRDLRFWATSFIKKAQSESEFVYQKSLEKIEWRKMFMELNVKSLLRVLLYRAAPPFVRVLPIFIYRLLFQTRLRDGWPAFHYSVLIALWYPILVDCFYLEKKWGRNNGK